MIEIPVYGGHVALIDEEDYRLEDINWFIGKGRNTNYAKCNEWPYLMHLFILPPKKGFVTDHIDNDGLNNQRNNLRYITNSDNIRRGNPGRPNKLGYRGIQYIRRVNKKPYRAEAVVDARSYYIGYFASIDEAVEARKDFLLSKGVNPGE